MSNKYNQKMKSTGGGSNKATGSPPALSMPETTAAWPGLPGPASKSRAAGVPTTGYTGKPFELKKVGM
jgi:hypothetical protein